ncbi:fatty-acyl-CoA synthase [Nocardioides daedukensis]|uniref:Fatty-acyl-CoA synthase n=1 Tax=Nocardioides daedukensis TaxID=634462 RepID=A0A7Y9S1I2_9ACTN|nr:AMP-binding protein [Nocardioides daedukensis]NYG58772.1 fatty-acyl-CoA synthase [Nocardioides daedukensis]
MSPDPTTMVATTIELLLARADDDNTALLFEESSWTWREFVAESAARAALIEAEFPDAEPLHVGVMMENTPEYMFWLGAAILSGATLVGVNRTRRGAELATDIAGTDLTVVICEEQDREVLAQAAPSGLPTWTVGTTAYDDRLAAHAGAQASPRPAALDPTARMLLLFTSGSTGAPKAVICSSGRFAALCQLNPIEFTPDDVAYNAMPLFHGNALMAAWGPVLANGAAYAMRRKFSASGFRPDLQRFGATFFNYVGRSLAYVLAQPERPDEAENRLRFGFGTEASAADRAEFARRFGCHLFESYGSSEGAIHIVRTPDTPELALGKPQIGYDADVVDEEGNECPPAELDDNGTVLNPAEAIGEIRALGAEQRFEGYYRNPEASAARLRDGHFYTGDLAYRDAEGFFYFAGRTADRLRVDSENLAARPIEIILERLYDVRAAAVYPVPDPHTGDAVMAALEVDPGFSLESFAGALAADPDLSSKAMPRFVRLCDPIPVTATRKTDKAGLRRDRWHADQVFERVEDGFVLVDETRCARLEEETRRHRTGPVV